MPGWMKWAIALLIGFAIIVVGFRWAGWLLTAFFILNCLVLMIVVLLQSGTAADLAGAFGGAGSQTAFGPRGAATILSQATTWCAVMFMVCAFAMVVRVDKGVESSGSVLQQTSRAVSRKAAPASKPPATQMPAPVSSTPQSSTPAAPGPQSSAPTSTPSSAPSKPASSQPAPAQPKKP
ncbi:MAG TPA: preprotein translocase subunit SecG [Candidatus Methylomirabilis sp.]|nr:preprotein translocase subunit SecG [Candidatus Methylomirabilis sp.]